MVSRVPIWYPGYQYGIQDTNMVFMVSIWYPGYQYGIHGTNMVSRVPIWYPGYQYGIHGINMACRVPRYCKRVFCITVQNIPTGTIMCRIVIVTNKCRLNVVICNAINTVIIITLVRYLYLLYRDYV